MEKKSLEDLLGSINLDLYITLLKVYRGDSCISEVLAEEGGVEEDETNDTPLQFSSISIQLTNDLSKEHKKGGGVFFTHPTVVKQTIDLRLKVQHLNRLSFSGI